MWQNVSCKGWSTLGYRYRQQRGHAAAGVRLQPQLGTPAVEMTETALHVPQPDPQPDSHARSGGRHGRRHLPGVSRARSRASAARTC